MGGSNIEKLGIELKPILKRNGLFVLGEMNDVANCDLKRIGYPVANCDRIEDHHEVPICNLKNIIFRIDKYI